MKSFSSFRNHKKFFEIVLLFHILAFAVLVFFVKTFPLFSIDLVISRFIQQIDFGLFDLVMRLLSEIGEPVWGVIFITVFVVFLLSIKHKKDALMLFVSSIGVIIVSSIVKILVARPRPPEELVKHLTEYVQSDSFPSGHVLHFIGLYGFLAFLIYKYLPMGWRKNALIRLVMLVIFLMGLSRIYMGVHWFSDVLGSYLIGMVWLYLMVVLYKKFDYGRK